MKDHYYLTAGAHAFITAPTGAGPEYGGKTVLANAWVAETVGERFFDMGLVFNPKGHRFVRGARVQSLQGFAQSYRSGKRHFNYVPQGDTEADHAELMRTIRQLPGRKIVAHDEAHEYAGSDMLDWMFRQGGNVADSDRWRTGDIQSLAISQHPWDLPEAVSNNVPVFVLVGPATAQTKRYFDAMQIPQAFEAIPDDVDSYHWSVIDGGEYLHTNPPVSKKYA